MKEKNKEILNLLQFIRRITISDGVESIENLERLVKELIEENEKPNAHERAPF